MQTNATEWVNFADMLIKIINHTRTVILQFHLYEVSRISKFIDRKQVRGSGTERKGKRGYYLLVIGFLFKVIENF